MAHEFDQNGVDGVPQSDADSSAPEEPTHDAAPEPEAVPSAEDSAAAADAEPVGDEEPASATEARPVENVENMVEPDEPAASEPEPEAVEPEPELAAPVEAEVEAPVEPEGVLMEWYVLKVQVNREDSIAEGLKRRIAMHGLDDFFGRILVPAEKVTEVRGGRKRTVRRKLLPGYIIVEMSITDDTWFLVRETPGVGDFTGASGTPTPMSPQEVQRLLATEQEEKKEEAKIKIAFSVGERVKIKDGTFENFEGEVQTIDETSGNVTVMINIFGRSTPVQFEYWQIEAVV